MRTSDLVTPHPIHAVRPRGAAPHGPARFAGLNGEATRLAWSARCYPSGDQPPEGSMSPRSVVALRLLAALLVAAALPTGVAAAVRTRGHPPTAGEQDCAACHRTR